MRKIVVSEFISLDGVIQAPGGKEEDTDGGFAHGGWTFPYWHDDIGGHFFKTLEQFDTYLLGRRTWQGHGAAFDPMPAGDPFGDIMKSRVKYVVSKTLTDTSLWRNSNIIKGNVIEEVRALKAKPGKNIAIDGSAMLVHELIQHDLVDEFSLLVYPLVLGGGKKLFPDGAHLKLKLIETHQFPTGVTLMRYERDRS